MSPLCEMPFRIIIIYLFSIFSPACIHITISREKIPVGTYLLSPLREMPFRIIIVCLLSIFSPACIHIAIFGKIIPVGTYLFSSLCEVSLLIIIIYLIPVFSPAYICCAILPRIKIVPTITNFLCTKKLGFSFITIYFSINNNYITLCCNGSTQINI